LLASGGESDTVRLWNPVENRLAHSFTVQSADVYAVAFGHKATLLASGNAQGLVLLRDTEAAPVGKNGQVRGVQPAARAEPAQGGPADPSREIADAVKESQIKMANAVRGLDQRYAIKPVQRPHSATGGTYHGLMPIDTVVTDQGRRPNGTDRFGIEHYTGNERGRGTARRNCGCITRWVATPTAARVADRRTSLTD
jgi:hypothetical protein